ncbi:MAG: ferritin family protein [Candidatus Riflebacteria bacterium]|nr:ferritin family protein [Candidatus Riflebacteria bacterium]
MKINADELMELAIQIERNGKEYFAAMAERSENPKVKQVFTLLVREEQSHLENFVKIRERLAEKLQDDFQIADEYNTPEMSAYIQAMSDGKVFPNLCSHDELVAEIRGDEQAIYHAISFEKDTILFFGDILGILGSEDENRTLIEELIRQEKIHIARLYTLLGSLK